MCTIYYSICFSHKHSNARDMKKVLFVKVCPGYSNNTKLVHYHSEYLFGVTDLFLWKGSKVSDLSSSYTLQEHQWILTTKLKLRKDLYVRALNTANIHEKGGYLFIGVAPTIPFPVRHLQISRFCCYMNYSWQILVMLFWNHLEGDICFVIMTKWN